LLIIVIVSVAACTTIRGTNPSGAGPLFPGEEIISDAEVFEVGLGVQIHSGVPVDLNVTHISPAPLTNNVPITGTITLGNHNSTSNTFVLTALVNYQQTISTIDSRTKVIHPTVVNAFSDRSIHFALQLPKEEGRYKLWWVVFAFPDEHDLDIQSRISLSEVYSFASDIIIGDVVSFPIPALNQSTPSMSSSPVELSGGPILTRYSSSWQTTWYTETVKANDVLPFFIHIRNGTRPLVNYALVAFLDGYQIPVQYDDPSTTVYWGTLREGSYAVIPASVPIPGVSGVHELEVLYVPEPYGVEGTEAGQNATPRSHSWGSSMLNSLRVGLITEP
jgi:hypothetical protein